MPKPKPLAFSDICRRLRKIGYEQLPGPDEHLITFSRVLAPYFPFVHPRCVAYHVPKYYQELPLLPAEIVEDIVLHLFLTFDEDTSFWKDDETPMVN